VPPTRPRDPRRTTQLPPEGRNATLDALRGLAIMAVVLVHVMDMVRPSTSWLANLCYHSDRGVQIFFLVSAFTLFATMERRVRGERHPWRNFFVRRFFRIAPLYYLAIGAVLILHPPQSAGPVLLHATFLHAWNPPALSSVVPGGWAIANEAMFYLAFPLLFRGIRNLKEASALLLLTLAARFALNTLLIPVLGGADGYRYTGDDYLSRWFFSQLPVFALGLCLHFFWKGRRGAKDPVTGSLLLLGSALLAFSSLFLVTYKNFLPDSFLFGLSFTLLAAGLLMNPVRALVNPLIAGLGRLSYCIYICHFYVIEFAKKAVTPEVILRGDGLTFLWYAAVLTVSAGLAWVLYRTIEQPGIALGRAFIRRWEGRDQSRRTA